MKPHVTEGKDKNSSLPLSDNIVRVSFVLKPEGFQMIRTRFSFYNKTQAVLETRKPPKFFHPEQNLVNEC